MEDSTSGSVTSMARTTANPRMTKTVRGEQLHQDGGIGGMGAHPPQIGTR